MRQSQARSMADQFALPVATCSDRAIGALAYVAYVAVIAIAAAVWRRLG